MQHNLATLADRANISVDTLRAIAHEHCGVPVDSDTGILDTWLYERLATAANLAGLHFTLMQDESILSMIDFSLPGGPGSFEERCQASFNEVVQNPIIRHEILLPETQGWEMNPESASFWRMAQTPDFYMGGALNESFGDTAEMFAHLLEET